MVRAVVVQYAVTSQEPTADRSRGTTNPVELVRVVDLLDAVEGLTFDRSVGAIYNGRDRNGTPQGGPNQLIDADYTHATYDTSGNMTELTVGRPSCWGRMPDCSHRFVYDWDEVGQMVRARRWDFGPGDVPAFDPNAPPVWDLAYAYSEGGRVLTSTSDAFGVSAHTLDVFGTLRVTRASYKPEITDYRVRPQNEVGFLAGGAARVFFDRDQVLPQAGATPLHVYLNIGDHLGSSAFVIDKDSSEVVERTTYQAFGATESDYRPDRWGAAREAFKFTGKEEDIEVGATYFGARYFNSRLGRWMSADPLTIHGLGADLNPYAYVAGRVSSFVDPFGLDGTPAPDEVFVRGAKRGSGARAAELASMAMDRGSAGREAARRAVRAGFDRAASQSVVGGAKKIAGAASKLQSKKATAKGFVRGAVSHHLRKLLILGCLFCDRVIGDPGALIAVPGDDPAAQIGADLDEAWFDAAVTVATVGAAGAGGAAGGGNTVYRGLAAGEDAAGGLVARAPDAGNSVASHVAGARASQWISTTRSLDVAIRRFGANGVVRIDLSKVGSPVVDLTAGIPGI